MQIWPQFSWLKALQMTIVSQLSSSPQVSSVILVWWYTQPFTLNWICFYLDIFWTWFFGRQLSIFDLRLKNNDPCFDLSYFCCCDKKLTISYFMEEEFLLACISRGCTVNPGRDRMIIGVWDTDCFAFTSRKQNKSQETERR